MSSIQRIGAFFDGTGNDKNNDVRINDGSLTNIGKLHEAYGGADKFYVEGVGTKHLSNAEVKLVKQGIADKNDYYNSSAMAFGTGVKDKVNAMIDKVKPFIANNPDSEVVIDVFGFSRGSTEARDFINEINTLYADNPNVKIGVAGLYDTVATVGLSNEYNDGLNLDLSGDSAERVIHLTAKDESRFNFSLESLKDENGNLPPNFMELEIAGAHADIGGGYKFTEKEYYKEESGFVQYTNELDKEYQINKIQQEALENGFEIKNINEVSNGMLSYDIMSSREVSYGLSNVSLKLMSDLLIQNGVPIDTSKLSNSSIPNDLNDYYNNLLHGDTASLSSELINKYVHNSDTGERTADSLSDALANFEEPSGQRDTYTNNPNNAASVFNREVSYSSEDNTFYYKNEKGNWEQLTYNENNDLLIYGDPSNPDKITFTDPTTGEYQEWAKDKDGNYIQTNVIDYSQIENKVINQIGSLIISNNNDFSNIEKIAVSTTVGTIADLSTYKGEITTDTVEESALDNLKGAALSFAISSYFAKNDNISDLIGADGTFVGEALDFATSFTASYAATIAIKEGSASAIFSKSNWGNFEGAIGSAIGGFIGSKIGYAVADSWIDTKEESMGASIGSAIGSTIGAVSASTGGALAAEFASLGSAAGPVGALIGAVIGVIVGSLLGGLFGGGTPPPPEALAYLEFDEETGTYKLISSSSDNGGSEEALINIGNSFAKQLVNMINIPGGQLVDADGMQEIYVSQFDELVKLNEQNGTFDSVSDMISNALSIQIPFINVEGADPYLLRAIHRTNESFFDDDPDNKGTADLSELYDNISLAQDYSKYMNEVMIILDANGNIITDTEVLQQINEEYQSINAVENTDKKNTLTEDFFSKYSFTTYKEYVNNLKDDISQNDIDEYYINRQNIEDSYDEQISIKNNNIININTEITSISNQLNSLNDMSENSNNSKVKSEILAQISNLNSQLSLLKDEKEVLQIEFENLNKQKEEAITSFDEENSKVIETIHWNEVFDTAEELKLDEHHYSEDFNKLNTEISKYNYDMHKENGELLEIDYDKYLKQIAQNALDDYKLRLHEEDLIEEQNQLLKENPKLQLEPIQIDEDALSKEESLDILQELGYDLDLGYEKLVQNIRLTPHEESEEVYIPTFKEFIEMGNALDASFDSVTEVNNERFEELLKIFDIENPYENFEPTQDSFSLQNKDITDLQFELKEGNLIITTFDKDLDEETAIDSSQSYVIKNWDNWDKENTHIDLPNGTKINLDALLDLIGVEEGSGVVDVQEAFNELALNDEDLSNYVNNFESDNILFGTSLDDKINAYFEDNIIKAGKGNDVINTGAGDDIIIGGSGSDTISASLGTDTVTYENSKSAIHTSLENGGILGDAKGDTYSGVENLTGTAFNDSLEGDTANNILKGNAGDDILSGGKGADTLIGGEGIDLADYSKSDDFVQVNLDENIAFNADAQGDTFDSIEGVRGSNYSDSIIGNDETNLIYSQNGNDRVATGNGNDIVFAGDGDDYIKGDIGNDELHGNVGNDILIGGEGNDTFYGGTGKNILLGDEGTDIAVYKGLSTEYEISFFNDHTVFIQSIDGTIKDTLKNIEEIAFDDAVFSIDYENQILIKKVQFDVTEEIEDEEQNIASENNSSNNQAAAIATAAMIGTVATAETIETPLEETNNNIIEEEDNLDDKNKIVPPLSTLDENSLIFEQVQKIIDYEKSKFDNLIKDGNENLKTISSTQASKTNEEIQNHSSRTHMEKVKLENNDNDINVNISNVVESSNEEIVEEELPTLLVPTINFETTDVLEDGILSGLKINNPNANSSITVIISGIPKDVSLSSGKRTDNGDWHLTQADLKDLKIITGINDSNDFDIKIVATVVDIHGRVIQNVLNDTIKIEAVSDTANLEVEQFSSNLEDNYIDLNISTSLVDTIGGPDGEESIILSIENVPDDAILTAGKKDIESGIWYLTPEDLDGLQIKRGINISDDFLIKVTSYTIESENNSIASISKDILVEVVAVADIPELEVHNAYGDEDTQIPVDIVSSLIDTDESEILSIKIEGIPDGAILNKGEKDSDGNWHLTPSQLGNLYLTPTLNDAEDFTIHVIARATENENGDIAEITKNIDVSINAVADKVNFDLTQTLSGTTQIVTEEDASITYLNIKTDFIDQDGSESIHYLIEGLPQGTSLNNGTEIETGKWELQVDDLNNLGIFLKENSDKDFQLKISAITTEEENAHQTTTVKYIDCKIESDADFANIEVSNAQGYENSFIDLDIKSSLTDTDGSETLEILIGQVPDGAILNKGEKDSDGNWHLKPEELDGLSLRPKFNSTDDIELKISAITTELKNGDTQENIAFMDIKVNKIPTNDEIKVNSTQILEDDICKLDIQIDETKMSNSDAIFLEITVPQGFSLNNGKKENSTTWKLYKEDLDNLVLNTPNNYAGNFFVEVVPTIIKSNGEVQKSTITTKLPVDIIPVADEASLEVTNITTDEDRLIYLNISSKLNDLDGSESLKLEITGIPSDAILNVGTKIDDIWVIEKEDIDLIAVLPSENNSDNMNLEIKAITTDSNGDTSVVTKNMTITINEVLDTPKLNVVDTMINNNEASLTISSELFDKDGSELLEININGLPQGTILNKGILNNDGSYSLNIEDLNDLKILGLQGQSNFDLSVVASSNNNLNIEKIISVNNIAQNHPLLFDINSNEYLSISETLDNIENNAQIEIKIKGLPNGSYIEPATLNKDGSYSVSSDDLPSLKIFNADNQHLSLDINITSSITNSFDPISKTSSVLINSDNYNLINSPSFNSTYNDLLSQLNGNTALYEISGIPQDAVVIPSGIYENGVYTFTKEELEQINISGINEEISLTLTANLDDEIIKESFQKDISVDIGETRNEPYMSLNNLQINSSTEDSSITKYSDAKDTIYSGGGNDEIYSNGGNDVIYSDESNGNVTVKFDLESISYDINIDEKIIYTIDNLPDNTISNVGNIVNNKLIIEKDNFDGKLILSYPYQNEQINLNVNTNIVNENNLNKYLSSSSIVLSIDPIDVAGNDYIDSGDGDDSVIAGDGDDIILTKAGNDIVFAGTGNDYIDTSSGLDRIDAGAGDDIIIMDSDDLNQNLFMNEIVNGGEGFDTVIIKDDKGVSFDMSLTNVESFIGGSGNDNIIGSEQNDIVRGGAGADTYYTKGGDDIVYIDSSDIVGNSGTFIDTGSGYDKIYIDDTKDVNFDVSNTNAEEIISGSGNDILRNNSNSEITINGMDGNDTIYVSKGKNILDGGDGIDTLDFSNITSGININLSTNVFLGNGIQNDTYLNFENVVGTNSDDIITGNESNNTFYAKGGNNIINGEGGFNTAVFSGNLIDYFNNSIVTNYDRTASVYTNSGINELTNIDVLQFDDYKVYINGTKNSPFVYGESINGIEDTDVIVTQEELLSNDFSIENSNLKIVGVKNSENGIAKLNEDGTISFTPYQNYNSSTNNIYDRNSALYKGEAKFEYIVEDENGNRSSAYATVNVTAVNDAPTIISNAFYRNSVYTGHGKIIIDDVDSDISSMGINVVSDLTYETQGKYTWKYISFDLKSGYYESILNTFTRSGYVNINGRTPDENGVFEFDYRGSYIPGHHYDTGRYDVFDMRPFTLSISDNGEPLSGENQETILLNTGTYYHYLRKDPIVIDLDGDGIELENRYYENLDDYLIGAGSDDAVLVWDKDNDGTISSSTETDWVSLSPTATNDLDALREIFDTNSDGFFNSDDDKWNQFALWQDKNQDGLVSDDEFIKIEDSSIKEFNLEKNEEIESDYPILEYASYTTVDGDIYDVASTYLDTTSTEEKLSEEDLLVIKQAAVVNEQLASNSLSNENDDEVIIEEPIIDENEYEEQIA